MKINEYWKTEELTVRRATYADKDRLKEICSSWENKTELEGEEFPDSYIEDCLTEGDLPPVHNADKSNYYLMVIEDTDNRVVGFFDIYHGYPDENTLWIGMYVIDKNSQGKSYGRESIQEFTRQAQSAGWKALGLAVYMKNWKGLRFWQKNGFDKIIGIYGEKEYGSNSFAIMGLRKELI